jgi:hypothetical protein
MGTLRGLVCLTAALLALSACGRGADAPGSDRTDPAPGATPTRKPLLARKGMDAYLRKHPALARQIEEVAVRRATSAGSWVSAGAFNGMSRLHVSIDADNLVVMEVVAPGGRMVAWARGTVLSRTPSPSGSLSDPGPVLRRFARWSTRMAASGPVLVGKDAEVPMVAVAR